MAFAGISTAASAQFGAVASVYSDYRFRGVSLSDGRPVAILDLSYDLPNGLYAALSGRLVETRDDGPQLLGASVNGGYALRLRPGLSADLGFSHSTYSHYSGLATGRSYSEVYAGLTGRILAARISISPNYLGTAQWTGYGELNGHIDVSRRTVIDAAIGALIRPGDRYRSGHPQFDGRIGIAYRLGRATLHAALVTRSNSYLYSARAKGPAALVVGLATSL